MECGAPRGSPEPQISWRKNGQTLNLSGGGAGGGGGGGNKRIRIVDGGNLAIQDARQSDDGRYQCVVKNIVGIRESATAFLKVHGKWSDSKMENRTNPPSLSPSLSLSLQCVPFSYADRRIRQLSWAAPLSFSVALGAILCRMCSGVAPPPVAICLFVSSTPSPSHLFVYLSLHSQLSAMAMAAILLGSPHTHTHTQHSFQMKFKLFVYHICMLN